jgi:hypothetical protein
VAASPAARIAAEDMSSVGRGTGLNGSRAGFGSEQNGPDVNLGGPGERLSADQRKLFIKTAKRLYERRSNERLFRFGIKHAQRISGNRLIQISFSKKRLSYEI